MRPLHQSVRYPLLKFYKSPLDYEREAGDESGVRSSIYLTVGPRGYRQSHGEETREHRAAILDTRASQETVVLPSVAREDSPPGNYTFEIRGSASVSHRNLRSYETWNSKLGTISSLQKLSEHIRA